MPLRLRLNSRVLGGATGPVLDAVTGLQATDNGDGTVDIDATDAASAPDGYRLYRQELDALDAVVEEVFIDTVAHGGWPYTDPFSAVVVEGSGFGTKSPALPAYFNDFEDEAVADHASSGGAPSVDPIAGLTHLQTSGAWTDGVSNTRSRSGTKSFRVIYDQADGFPNLGIALSGSPLSAYQAMHVYWERMAGAGGIGNFKFGRIGAGAPYSGNPKFVATLGLTEALTGSPTNTDISITQDTGPVFTEGVNFTELRDDLTADVKDVLSPDGWHFLEYLYRLSTPGVANGFVQIRVDGVVILNKQNIQTRLAGVTDALAWIITPFDGADTVDASSTFRLYADEMLLDKSFARVIVTDNATYASSTKFAPQSCTEWADSAIGIAHPNWSNLAAGVAYAHVWDSENNYIGHYEVTVP